MKIACVTMTYNDGFKFKDWCDWYEEYKDDFFLHIVVDNGSKADYLACVKNYFKNSIIIERKSNGGCTAAYNDGIRYALKNKDIDAIMLVGNDVRLKKGCVPALFNYLYSDAKLGMVAPVVLKKDSDIIEDFGVTMTFFNSTFNEQGRKLSEITPGLQRYADLVPGGINLSKREFYEHVGLQDENLFMYCDERDMYYRGRNLGYKEGVTSNAVAWHQHIFTPPISERLRVKYLTGRNRIYVERKDKGFLPALVFGIYSLTIEGLSCLKHLKDKERKFLFSEYLKGVISGFKGEMSNTNLWY